MSSENGLNREEELEIRVANLEEALYRLINYQQNQLEPAVCKHLLGIIEKPEKRA